MQGEAWVGAAVQGTCVLGRRDMKLGLRGDHTQAPGSPLPLTMGSRDDPRELGLLGILVGSEWTLETMTLKHLA